MGNAVGEGKKKRTRVLDLILLVGAGLIVAATSTAAFWMADEHHISSGWLLAAGAALIFFLVVGWGYRRKFRDPAFVSFLWLGRSYTCSYTCWFWPIWVSRGTSQLPCWSCGWVTPLPSGSSARRRTRASDESRGAVAQFKPSFVLIGAVPLARFE
jgi:hypothetical protein